MNPEIYGIIAIAFGTIGFLWKNPRHILVFASLATATWCLYFIALNETSALISASIGLGTILCSLFVHDKWMKPIMLSSCAIVGLMIFPFDLSFIGLVVWLGYSLKTIGLLWRDNPFIFRSFMVAGELFYLSFGLMAGAYSTIAWSSFIVLSAVSSGVYYAWKTHKHSPPSHA